MNLKELMNTNFDDRRIEVIFYMPKEIKKPQINDLTETSQKNSN